MSIANGTHRFSPVAAPDVAPVPNGPPVDKVEKFGWVITDQPGELMWLDKGLLQIDHEYQRDHVNNERVLRITRQWSWVACGTLAVGRRADGTFWVMDGQHRKLAADKRSDIPKLPCMVFRVYGKSQEAGAFLSLNTERGPVKTIDKFNALVMAKDAHALAVKSMVEADGYTIKRGAHEGNVQCLGTLMSAVRKDGEVAKVAWVLCTKLYQRKGNVHDKVFSALFNAESFMRQQECGSLCDPHNVAALIRHDVTAVINSINAAVAYHGGGEKAGAEGVIRLLNKGRRTRVIPSPYGSAEAPTE